MELIADGLLILAALAASIYCMVLSKRLRRLNQLDAGLGGAIAALSGQVDEMRGALNEAKMVTERSKRELDQRTKRAEAAAGRLEILLAAVRNTRPGSAGSDAGGLGTQATGADDAQSMAQGADYGDDQKPLPSRSDLQPGPAPQTDDLAAGQAGGDRDDAMLATPIEYGSNQQEDETLLEGGLSPSDPEAIGSFEPGNNPEKDEFKPTQAIEDGAVAEEDAWSHREAEEAEAEVAEAREEKQDKELRLADAFSDLGAQSGENGISKDLLRALEAMADGGKS